MKPSILLLINGVFCMVAFALCINKNQFSDNMKTFMGKWFRAFQIALISVAVFSLLMFGFQMVRAGWL